MSIKIENENLSYSDLVDAYKTIVNFLIYKLGYNDEVEASNFLGTPERAARALNQIIFGKDLVKNEIERFLKVNFETSGNSMVTHGPFRAISMCPHHLLPIVYDVVLGYIPRSKVLGLSKLPRFGKMLARQPILQEDYTENLATNFIRVVDPLGFGAYVEGVHGCMACRGVESTAPTITTKIYGNFSSDPKIREEFMQYVELLMRRHR